jgi:hypothetical protein
MNATSDSDGTQEPGTAHVRSPARRPILGKSQFAKSDAADETIERGVVSESEAENKDFETGNIVDRARSNLPQMPQVDCKRRMAALTTARCTSSPEADVKPVTKRMGTASLKGVSKTSSKAASRAPHKASLMVSSIAASNAAPAGARKATPKAASKALKSDTKRKSAPNGRSNPTSPSVDGDGDDADACGAAGVDNLAHNSSLAQNRSTKAASTETVGTEKGAVRAFAKKKCGTNSSIKRSTHVIFLAILTSVSYISHVFFHHLPSSDVCQARPLPISKLADSVDRHLTSILVLCPISYRDPEYCRQVKCKQCGKNKTFQIQS